MLIWLKPQEQSTGDKPGELRSTLAAPAAERTVAPKARLTGTAAPTASGRAAPGGAQGFARAVPPGPPSHGAVPSSLPRYRWGNRGSEVARVRTGLSASLERLQGSPCSWGCVGPHKPGESPPSGPGPPAPAALARRLVPQGTPAARAHSSAGRRMGAGLTAKAPANASTPGVAGFLPGCLPLPPLSAGRPVSTLRPAVGVVTPGGSHGHCAKTWVSSLTPGELLWSRRPLGTPPGRCWSGVGGAAQPAPGTF